MVLLIIILSFSGCALLQIPVTIIDGTFKLLGQIFRIIERMPKPPPGVF